MMAKAIGIAASVALLAFVGTFGRALWRSKRWKLPDEKPYKITGPDPYGRD